MAKKKQFAGKKTKLAKLPLTQVLTNQGGETAPWGQLRGVPAPGAHRPEPPGGTAGSLVSLYLDLIQDLTVLRSHFSSHGDERPVLTQKIPLLRDPKPHRLHQVLRSARESLLELYHYLSSSSR